MVLALDDRTTVPNFQVSEHGKQTFLYITSNNRIYIYITSAGDTYFGFSHMVCPWKLPSKILIGFSTNRGPISAKAPSSDRIWKFRNQIRLSTIENVIT